MLEADEMKRERYPPKHWAVEGDFLFSLTDKLQQRIDKAIDEAIEKLFKQTTLYLGEDKKGVVLTAGIGLTSIEKQFKLFDIEYATCDELEESNRHIKMACALEMLAKHLRKEAAIWDSGKRP